MTRYDFQKLASVRLEEARVLLRDEKYAGCFYLSGYVVECGLKACIARLTKRYDFPDKALLRDVYTHDLTQLLKMTKLEGARESEAKRDNKFKFNWQAAKDWNEQSRYESPGKKQAEELFDAVANRKHGVLRWIRQHW